MEKVERIVGPVATLGGGVVGELSLADVSLYVFIREYHDDKAGAAAAISKCPNITAAIEAIESHPKVASYLERRPMTPF